MTQKSSGKKGGKSSRTSNGGRFAWSAGQVTVKKSSKGNKK